MMESKKSTSYFLKVCLTMLMVFIVIQTISICIYSFKNGSSIHPNVLIATTVRFMVLGVYLFIIYELKAIISTVTIRKPFCVKNIIRFKNISKCIFLLGAFDTLDNINSSHGNILIGTPYFNIKLTTFIFIILGCLALVLAEVFQMAVEIKKENDLTI